MPVSGETERADVPVTLDIEPAESLVVHGLEVLKVIADPRRMLIVDLLRREPATVKELAPAVGMPPKSLYYHVRMLEKHGLIRVVDSRIVYGILEKRYRATAHLFYFDSLAQVEGATSGQGLVESIATILGITADDIRLGVESGTIDVRDDAPIEKSILFNWGLLDLTLQQRKEFDERLVSLVCEFDPESVPPNRDAVQSEATVSANGATNGTRDMSAGDATQYRLLIALFPSLRGAQRPDLPPLNHTEGDAS